MKHQWLQHSENAKNIIVFFSGWGFGATVVQNLAIEEDTNVLFINDYRCLDYELPNLERYQHRYLIAWSFGVAAYNAWQQQSPHTPHFDSSVAINGSMTPVDRRTGIPNIVMQKTIDTLSVESFQVFAKKCFDALDSGSHTPFAIDVDARKKELIHIQQWQSSDKNLDTSLQWNKVWISKHDKIFPLRNLQRAWQDHTERLEFIEAAHSPFNYWNNWSDIIT